MAMQPRSRSKAGDQEAMQLLQALIEAPPAPAEVRSSRVVLRSTTELRNRALAGFQFRTWVDAWLQHAERILLLAVVLVFGYWLADGPVRDWLHEQQSVSTVTVAAAAVSDASAYSAAPVMPERSGIVPLPYTTPNDLSAPSGDDFIAPRQGVLNEPIAQAPQPTRLIIPALALDTSVKEVFIVDGAWEVADYAAGYLHNTGLPGTTGNTVLAGHAGLRGGVFRDLGDLVVNDDIYLDAAGWRYHYRVRELKSVWPTQVEVLDPSSTSIVTLITCTNWDTQRLVVTADLIDSKPTPSS